MITTPERSLLQDTQENKAFIKQTNPAENEMNDVCCETM
jgi:hypothetical protein